MFCRPSIVGSAEAAADRLVYDCFAVRAATCLFAQRWTHPGHQAVNGC